MMATRRRRKGWNEVDKSQIPVSEVLQAYLMYQEDRNHSPKTIRWYRDLVGRFATSLGPDAQLGDVTPEAIRSFQRGLRQSDRSKFTLHAYARTLKTFLRWLHREGYVGEELHRRVEMPKVPKYEDVAVDVLSDEEIAQLLAMLDQNTDLGARNRAIVCLMLESGLRLAEVAGLAVDDVHLKEMYIKVHGKGEKESYVPIGPTTQKALARYATHFRVPADLRTKAFFLNIFGEPLGVEAIKSYFVRLAKQTGIHRLHPHLLRHTAATRLLANGADLHTVQRLLRHSDIRTTLRYLHLVPEQLQEKMRMFSPLGGIAGPRRRIVSSRLTRMT
jgi:integrase/recombinase XerC/integrase/recombinase XerD